ncbi:hypothetical protein P3G55_20780 [Leptospira sp. 96542]|nr:hypothetical protein [Leptospira sp. 96542]
MKFTTTTKLTVFFVFSLFYVTLTSSYSHGRGSIPADIRLPDSRLPVCGCAAHADGFTLQSQCLSLDEALGSVP